MITVLTATLPERRALLAEMTASLAHQNVQPDRWLVEWDHAHRGPVQVINDLAHKVETDWLFPFADDDLLDPDHFETLIPELDDESDIVYTWCRVEGGQHHERFFQNFIQDEHGWDYLRTANWIPAAAAIRTNLWHKLGGYQQPEWTQHEDHDLWVRALDAGARFKCVPQVTWTYRMGDWAHRSTT